MSPYEDDELDAGCAAENKELKKAKKRSEWILLRPGGGRNEREEVWSSQRQLYKRRGGRKLTTCTHGTVHAQLLYAAAELPAAAANG
jgi:hypothetical protein